ncbi:MAG: hypothetical protein R2911_35720 [Caldilineaceae bacterium]
MSQFITLDVRSWQDEKKLMALIKDFYIRQTWGDLPKEMVVMMAGEMDEEDYLQGVEQMLADADIGEEGAAE